MRWRRDPQVLWRTAPGYLVLALVDGRTIEIGGSANAVWSSLADWVDEHELAADLTARHHADEQVVTSDVTNLLRDLHRLGYVERRD